MGVHAGLELGHEVRRALPRLEPTLVDSWHQITERVGADGIAQCSFVISCLCILIQKLETDVKQVAPRERECARFAVLLVQRHLEWRVRDPVGQGSTERGQLHRLKRPLLGARCARLGAVSTQLGGGAGVWLIIHGKPKRERHASSKPGVDLHLAFFDLSSHLHMRVDAVPTPFWVLRHHAPAPVHWVGFANDGRLLIAGDAEGRVSVTSLADYRPRLFWKAHSDTVLRADAWAGFLVTHGRDHCVRVWTMPEGGTAAPFVSGDVGTATSAGGDAGSAEGQEDAPPLAMSVPVNALNYCAYDMALSDGAPDGPLHGWIAVPHTLDAAFIDVYALPTRERVFEAIGRDTNVATPGAARRPIVMAVRLLQGGLPDAGLCALAAYEDGSVQLWALHVEDRTVSLVWSHISHRETVTALALDPDGKRAFSVGADDMVVCHALESDRNSAPKAHATRHPGNACAAVRMDGHILAVGGWDNMYVDCTVLM